MLSGRSGTLVAVTKLPGCYGPDTESVESALDGTANLDETVLDELRKQMFIAAPYRHFLMPRDYAWKAFHDGLKHHGLVPEFEALWVRLREQQTSHGGYLPARDYVGATMMESHVDVDGPFTRADADILMAPWRCVVDKDPRSTLFLAMAARWPFPGGPLWPIVDAVLPDAD